MVVAVAAGVRRARVAIAHFAAHAVQAVAGLVVGAVLVVLADAADARDQRVTLHADRAMAAGPMVLGAALGVTAALDAAEGARVHAFVVVARLVVRAVGVDAAFGCGEGGGTNWKH